MANPAADLQAQYALVMSAAAAQQAHAQAVHASAAEMATAGGQRTDVIEIRCLLDNAAVGGIIGKGGNSVRQVREESQAFVSIVKADFRHVQERIMVLKGTVEQIAAAAKGITVLLIDVASRREDRLVETAQLKLLVHKTAVGAIIGRGGESIKATQAETGARVQVSNETLPSSSEKSVTLTGTPNQMHAAVARIATQLLQNPLKPGTKVFPYVPHNAQYAPQPAYGSQVPYAHPGSQPPLHLYPSSSPLPHQSSGYGGLIRAPPPPPAVLSTQKIAIPTICCGSIIGKGGAVIRDLRAQSQTNISISDPDEATPNERVVTLQGTPAGISHAVFLIRQLVETYQPTPAPQQLQQHQPTSASHAPPQQF